MARVRTKPPIFGRGLQQGQFRMDASNAAAWGGRLPDGRAASFPEFLVWRELTTTHKMSEPGDFSFQHRLTTTGGLPGRAEVGGLIADFLLIDSALVINPLSEYYHYRDGSVVANERTNRELLAQQGITVVWIDSDALEKNPGYYVREALDFRDHSRLAQGLV